MIFDQMDAECLKIIGLCRYLPTTLSNKYSNKVIMRTTTENLQDGGLIRLTSDNQCYKLTSVGRGTLQDIGYEFKADPRSLVKDRRYARRKLCADVNVMFHTAGINIFAETPEELNKSGTGYIPLLNVRSLEKGAALSCAHMAGVLRSGDIAYGRCIKKRRHRICGLLYVGQR